MITLEQKIKAKIPGADTGIEVKKTVCDVCAPDHHCGINAYVKDGKVLKVEGCPDHPYSQGKLCTKGLSNRDYIYRDDRIRTPMKRVGPKGQEGNLVPISWDEAYKLIAEGLNKTKAEYGPHSVAFFSGHGKWFRPMFQRFAHDFGSVNYGSDCSVCVSGLIFGRIAMAGCNFEQDVAHANTFLGWGFNSYYSGYQDVLAVQALKDRGGKVIIIDPRQTPSSKNLADIYLQIKPGTDGALAHGMAKLILDNGWEDKEFLANHTTGFEEYKEYIQQFDLDTVSRITGIEPQLIYEATKLYATNGPAAIHEACFNLAHGFNAEQNYRAITQLNLITGNFDRAGGSLPRVDTYNMRAAGFETREGEFACATRPDHPRIGEGKFPLWDMFMKEFQITTMVDQILTGDPYPVRSIFALGLNVRQLPDTNLTKKALESLDFFVNTDLFLTDACKYADVVLPACSSFERGEFKVYPGGWAMMTKPVIEPLYESKNDVQILLDLMPYLGIEDELLAKGYDACIDWIIDGCGLTVADLKAADGALKVPAAKEYVPGSYTAGGVGLPSGKYEFHSNLIGMFQESHGLEPIAKYVDCFADDEKPEYATEYPYFMTTGARLPNTIHSRLHEVPVARSLRPVAMMDISPEDAQELGVVNGDVVEVSSPTGSIQVPVNITGKNQKGNVHLAHGYREADSSVLINHKHLDPYSGFPGYKSVRCNIRKVEA